MLEHYKYAYREPYHVDLVLMLTELQWLSSQMEQGFLIQKGEGGGVMLQIRAQAYHLSDRVLVANCPENNVDNRIQKSSTFYLSTFK